MKIDIERYNKSTMPENAENAEKYLYIYMCVCVCVCISLRIQYVSRVFHGNDIRIYC